MLEFWKLVECTCRSLEFNISIFKKDLPVDEDGNDCVELTHTLVCSRCKKVVGEMVLEEE